MNGIHRTSALLRLIPSGLHGNQRFVRLLLNRSRAIPGESGIETRRRQRIRVPNAQEPIGFSRHIFGEHEPGAFDVGEQRLRSGDAQRFLREMGFQFWRLEEYRQGRAPLDGLLKVGGEMLVVERLK